MSEEVNTPEVPNETAAPQEPQISLADFSAALQVIDVCTTRGAFRGEELSSVGQLRDRLKAFVDHHAPADESEAEETSTEEATSAD